MEDQVIIEAADRLCSWRRPDAVLSAALSERADLVADLAGVRAMVEPGANILAIMERTIARMDVRIVDARRAEARLALRDLRAVWSVGPEGYARVRAVLRSGERLWLGTDGKGHDRRCYPAGPSRRDRTGRTPSVILDGSGPHLDGHGPDLSDLCARLTRACDAWVNGVLTGRGTVGL